MVCLRARFYLETALALIGAALTVLTLTTPAWIEVVLPLDPDGGDGSVEWGLTASLLVATVLCAVLARHEVRRVRVGRRRASPAR